MKKPLYLLLIALLICKISWAQAPEKFNYQAVIRDNTGELLINQDISLQISILEGSTTGSVIFSEVHNETTNAYGIVNIEIGNISGDLSSLSWESGDKFLKIEIDAGSGFTDLGTVQLLTVPYALYADIADSAKIAATAYTAYFADSTNIAATAYTAYTADVLGSDGVYSTSTDTLFVVKDHSGNVVFAVFPDGAQVIVNETVKGSIGGFAVSGRSPSKAGDIDILKVTVDSTRIFVSDSIGVKGKVGGFAVSGRSPSKGLEEDYLMITPDSTRIYVNQSAKGSVGGFAVSGRSPSKGTVSSLMNLTKDNYFIGHESGISISNGLYNSFFGYQSGMDNFSGYRNIFMGYQSGFSNVSGSDNTFVGNQSGMDQQTGNDNIYIGNESGENILEGTRNIYIGKQAGFNADSSINTVAIGYQSGYSNTVDNNTFIGPFSGMANNTGRENVYLGHTAGQWIESGGRNVIMGAWAGHYGTKGENNVLIGAYAGNVTADSLSGNVIIGSFAGRSNTSSNRLIIDNTSTSSPLIYGDFNLDRLSFNGNVGVNRTAYSTVSLGVSPVGLNYGIWVDAGSIIYAAYFNGDIYTTGSYLPSDEKFKKNITPISQTLKELSNLNVVYYDWKTEEFPEKKFPERKQIGFLAQEVEKSFPELVKEDLNGNKAINYSKFTPILVEAIKEQQQIIEEQKDKISNLEERLTEIEKLLMAK